ncbi:MAG: MBOAT family protein [Candidatus Electrothrix sp. MAN1_4]|nr:MBOAT family protein [Candidatus Electrothrix sp. MAN1_4]
MVFSSPIFLFGFLPITLLLYYSSPRAMKNIILLLCSLFFYAWGEILYVLVMVASIFSNYFFGRLLGNKKRNQQKRKIYVALGITVNLALLIFFKYSNFIIENLNKLLVTVDIAPVHLDPVHLPLGISFFTFQAISYLVDVYRKEVPAQKNILNLSLYISLFPQLIAGPIVRYHDIALQLTGRLHSLDLFSSGVKRFVYGLAKKMLLANPLGEVADSIFALSGNDLTLPLAWIGIFSYTLQIFFDFSGYSDMAIGLGRMFGIRFQENFNYPYIARSLREFWRRWHISLSTWFRDYLYIPLGGSRVPTSRVYFNLLIVFILTGLWHGANWNFLLWGLFHGVFLAAEHAGLSRNLKNIGKPMQHMYALTVIIIGWVFFRTETFDQAFGYLYAMINLYNYQTTALQFAQVLSFEAIYVFIAALMLSIPVSAWINKNIGLVFDKYAVTSFFLIKLPQLGFVSLLLFLSIVKIASSTYNPFIYFRF